MNWADIGGEIAKFAPAVAEGLMGNIPGAIVSVARALDSSASPDAVHAALAADPQAEIKLRALDVQLAQIKATTRAQELAADTARVQATAGVAEAEQVHGDTYVKHTRPLLARLAFYAGTAYALLAWGATTAAPLLGFALVPGPSVQVLTMLYTPLLAYMGLRTWDGFSARGKTK
jgi:hypothetical protein